MMEIQFDFIVLNDVIEHVLKPDLLIEKLTTFLKVGGKILIWTPNGENILDDKQRIALRVDLEHLQYLSSQSIAELCKANNLHVNHYEQLGFPSTDNFQTKMLTQSKAASLQKIFVWIMKKLHILEFAKKLLESIGFTRQTHSSLGNYHLFCCLVKGS